LTLIIICGLLLSIVITVGVSVIISSNVITEEALDKIEINTESEATNLNSWLSAQQANLATLADVLSALDSFEADRIRPIFKNIIDDNPAYTDVYMGFPDNTAVMGSGFAIEELYDTWKASERSWYQVALTDQKHTHITPPYIDTMTGELCLTVSHAITKNGQVVGVAGADILLGDVTQLVNNITFGGTGYSMLIGTDGSILIHPGDYAPTRDGNFFNLKTVANGIFSNLWTHINVSSDTFQQKDAAGVEKYYTSGPIKSADWFLIGILEKSVTTQPINNLILIVVLITICIVAVVAVVMYIIVSRTVSKPIKNLADIAENVAKGNLNVNIETSAKDETGVLAKSFADMISVINSLIAEINELGRGFQVTGDLDMKLDSTHFNGSYREVTESINNTMGGIIGEIVNFLECLSKFSEGDFNADIPKLPGKKIIMNQTLDNMRGNLKSVSKDMGTLVNNAIQGKLSAKVDVSAYKGDWAVLMHELNRLMEVIIEPISEASEVLSHVSKGTFDHKMDGDYKGDFLVIKEAMNTTVGNIASYIDEISGVLGSLAEDDFDQDIKREYVGMFSSIKNALLNIIAKFNNVISSIASASDQVASGARMISESSMNLATGATEQASSVEELSATIQTINENTTQNAESARIAKKLSDELKVYAEKGNEDMDQMLSSMNGIKDSSSKIAKIIKVIEDIAFQTNLLALNAAVEAARAGAHGKGFSVVADEVRSLASKTTVSAKETAELIEEAISRVDDGTEIANQTDDALKAIVSEAVKVADVITNISKASDEQAVAIGQVMTGINQITNVVQQNSASAEESASASEELASQSDVLKNMVSVFKLKRL